MTVVQVFLRVCLCAISLRGTSAVAAHACASEDGAEDEACATMEAPRMGGVMLQTVAGTQAQRNSDAVVEDAGASMATKDRTKLGPLSLRLDNVNLEIASLQDRVAALETEVLGTGGMVALQATELGDVNSAASLLAKAANLRQSPSVKDRTAAAEANIGAIKSQLSSLENQVRGVDPSLLEIKDVSEGSSLKSRIDALEKEVDSCRSRVSTLEHMVVG